MKDLSQLDCKDSIRNVIRRDLKETGIKIPKIKCSKSQNQALDQIENGVFGVLLENVPSVNVCEDGYCSVPKFIVDSVKFLSSHLGTEGLFRKSGSVSRQKVLKEKIEAGESFGDNTQPHDVAALLKQFFRELPEPLLTNHLHDSFIKAQHLCTENESDEATLQLCLMLPLIHMQTLQFVIRFFARVATRSNESKMSMSNLAIVLTPNLMPQANKKDNNSAEKLMKDQRFVIDRLLQNAHHIGMVREDVINRAAVSDNTESGATSSGDELDGDPKRGRTRHRTGSIHGLVSGIGQSLSRFKTSTSSTKTPSHRRSRSVPRVVFTNNKYKVQEETSVEAQDECEIQLPQQKGNLPVATKGRKNSRYKRKPVDQITGPLSPPTKRPSLMKDYHIHSIGQPNMVSIPNQMFTTPTRPIVPLRPLSDFVKKNHSELLKVATEHVKVVDTSSYIPSPETPTSKNTLIYSPGSSVRSLDNSSVNKLERNGVNSGQRPVRPKRRLARRHSSGAVATTRCFSSSPKTKENSEGTPKSRTSSQSSQLSPISSPAIKTPKQLTPLSVTLETMNVLNNPKSRKAIVGYKSGEILVATPIYNNRKYSDRSTPCKLHKDTPPQSSLQTKLNEVIVENVL